MMYSISILKNFTKECHNMVDKFERKCVELFGECPLDIHDIVAANSGYSEKELILEAARKYYLREQHNFFEALCEWKNGNKLQISREEAEKRNRYFENAKMIVDEASSTIVDSLVNWMAFPNDDPTICYYIGIPFDDELCVWAKQYNK